MAVYFASDMHLRLDRPDRGRRLARWIRTLHADDRLFLVGDVCDFWFAARQQSADPLACEGLRALAEFRQAGGELTILPGNHDLWLGPFYEKTLGAVFVSEPLLVEAHGLRVRLVHGHRAGGRQAWKSLMETRAFLKAFRALPAAAAARLDRRLNASNARKREQDEDRLIPFFRRQLPGLVGKADIAVFGHVHRAVDDPTSRPRFIVLGGWHDRSSFLRVDDRGAELVVRQEDRATRPAV